MTPAISFSALETLDPAEIDRMEDAEAADALDGNVRRLEAILRTAFMQLGYITSTFQKRELWRYIFCPKSGQAFSSFNAWLLDAAPYSRSHCYAAKGIYEELEANVPRGTLMQINETNARVLVQVSKGSRRKMAESAVTLSEDEFVAKVQQDLPNQHIEVKRKLVFHPTESAYQVIVQTLDYVGSKMEIQDRDGQLEALCAHFLTEHSDDG